MRRLLALDMGAEATAAIAGRPMRSGLTTLGIAVGVTALTAMIGMSTSGADSIGSEFDALRATRVEVTGPESLKTFQSIVGQDGIARTEHLNGVEAAGTIATSSDKYVAVRPLPDTRARELPLLATTVGGLRAERSVLVAGRTFDAGHETRGDRTVLLGIDAAAQAGISTERVPSLISVNDITFVVAGIVTTDDSASPLPSSVIMPWHTVERVSFDHLLGAPTVVIRTLAGAAEQVGSEAPIALSPRYPQRLSSAVPPRPVSLERAIRKQTQLQLIALAAVSIVVGAIGVSNTTLVGVLERRQEIGVRRAIGASGRAIVMQFLFESASLGLLGGCIGSLVGGLVTFSVSTLNSWNLVVPPWLWPLGPALGLLVGVLAGAYPAYRASRIEPIEALRA